MMHAATAFGSKTSEGLKARVYLERSSLVMLVEVVITYKPRLVTEAPDTSRVPSSGNRVNAAMAMSEISA